MNRSPLKLLGTAFVPEESVSDPRLFSGRRRQVQLLAESLHDAGSVPVVYGHRGVGKTSLLRQYGLIARGDVRLLDDHGLGDYALEMDECYDVLEFEGSALDSLSQLESQIARRLMEPRTGWQPKTRKMKLGGGFRGISAESEIEYSLEASDELDFDEVLSRHVTARGRRLLVLVDEFDLFTDRQNVASWLRKIPSELIRIALCGIGQDILDLLEGHPSLERKILPVRVPPMSEDESFGILTRGAQLLADDGFPIVVPQSLGREMARFSGGFPWFMHFLGREAFRSAIERGSSKIGRQDLVAAQAILAGERWLEKYESLYRALAGYPGPAETAIRFIAAHAKDSNWSVPATEAQEYLGVLTSDPGSLLDSLVELGVLALSRGPLAERGAITFADPAFRIFCNNRPPIGRPYVGSSVPATSFKNYEHRVLDSLAPQSRRIALTGRHRMLVLESSSRAYTIADMRAAVLADIFARSMRRRRIEVETVVFAGGRQLLVDSGIAAELTSRWWDGYLATARSLGVDVATWVLIHPEDPEHQARAIRMFGALVLAGRVVENAEHLRLASSRELRIGRPRIHDREWEEEFSRLSNQFTEEGLGLSRRRAWTRHSYAYVCGHCFYGELSSPELRRCARCGGEIGCRPVDPLTEDILSLMQYQGTSWQNDGSTSLVGPPPYVISWAARAKAICVASDHFRQGSLHACPVAEVICVGGVSHDVRQMSKSFREVVDTSAALEEFGSDAIRLQFAWGTQPGARYVWDWRDLPGAYRFLRKVWLEGAVVSSSSPVRSAKVARLCETLGALYGDGLFNKTRAPMYALLREVRAGGSRKADYVSLLDCLEPLAPRLAHQAWRTVAPESRFEPIAW